MQLFSPVLLLNYQDEKDYKLPALLANGTIGPYPSRPYDVALSYGDYYFTQAVLRLAKV